jgi:hypothetical protein
MAQGNNLNLELVPSAQAETDGRKPRKQSVEHESRAYQPYPVGAIFSIKTVFLAGTDKTSGYWSIIGRSIAYRSSILECVGLPH